MSLMYLAYFQMPLVHHPGEEGGEAVAVVLETEMYLAAECKLAEGMWIYDERFDGLMLIAEVIYDTEREAMVATTAGAAYDYTATLNEWLVGHPLWHKVSTPFIDIRKVKLTEEEPTPGDHSEFA